MSRLRQLTAAPKTLQADELVAQARQALAAGRRHEARRWVWDALQADPESVTAWLMLAALASPRASLNHVRRALELRPHNPVALRALEWAEGRQVSSLKGQGTREEAEAEPPVSPEAAETLLHAPAVLPTPASLEATVAHVELGGEALWREAEPESAEEITGQHAAMPAEKTVTSLKAQGIGEEPEAEPSALATAAETLLHAPSVPEAEQTAPGLKAEGTNEPEDESETEPPAPATLEATAADVGPLETAAAEATVLHIPTGPEPEPSAPATLDATVADVASGEGADLWREAEPEEPEAITGQHATIPVLPESEEDRLSDTAPNKAAGRAALTLLGLGLIIAVGLVAALAWGGRFQDPARPAAVAAIPIGHFLKSTLRPTATDTPTVTPSPTWTPTFTPTPSITPTPTATATNPPFEAWAGTNEGRWIDVNLSLQTLTAMEGQQPVQSFSVSTGLWNTPTVTGDYHVYVKYVAADMSGPGYYLPQVPYVMYFYRDYGIHGTYWHNNFGHPMSHGCVNMRTDQAGWLYDWASVGTLVHVHE